MMVFFSFWIGSLDQNIAATAIGVRVIFKSTFPKTKSRNTLDISSEVVYADLAFLLANNSSHLIRFDKVCRRFVYIGLRFSRIANPTQVTTVEAELQQ